MISLKMVTQLTVFLNAPSLQLAAMFAKSTVLIWIYYPYIHTYIYIYIYISCYYLIIILHAAEKCDFFNRKLYYLFILYK